MDGGDPEDEGRFFGGGLNTEQKVQFGQAQCVSGTDTDVANIGYI